MVFFDAIRKAGLRVFGGPIGENGRGGRIP
jgi:hypothetical protein